MMSDEYTDEQIQEWDKEDMGHLPDGFFLSQSEIDELRNQKYELTQYARQKLKELKHKEALEIARQGIVEYKDALEELKDD
jgi:hypothetical protein